jgi:uncharacterized protein (DUF4415 family)
MYNNAQVKRRKAFTKRREVVRLQASANENKPIRGLPADLARFYKPIKKSVTLRLDAEVLAWFKRQGPGYQTRINRALRKVMMEERK